MVTLAIHEPPDFYPRPPRGGRRLQEIDARKKARKFLSTPSARRATYIEYVLLKHLEISIHALREEGDVRLSVPRICEVDFYPRPPRGGRLSASQFMVLR